MINKGFSVLLNVKLVVTVYVIFVYTGGTESPDNNSKQWRTIDLKTN